MSWCTNNTSTMFSSNILLDKELKEKAKLQRKKMFEEERKKRIFNTKQRIIGIDKKELEKQMQEKKLQQDFEKSTENQYYRNQIYAIEEADKLENEINEIKRMINKEINEFRKLHQRKATTNDDSEGNNYQIEPGISSGLMFDGEDNDAKHRKLLQTQQQRYWLIQQMAEKKQISNEKSLSEKIHGESLNSIESRATAMENLERECRRLTQITIKEYNEALARERIFKKSQESKKEQEDKEFEIMNAITSDLLTENTEVAQSNLGPQKIIQYNYKGMSEREQLEIRKKQLEQIKERKMMMDVEHNYNQKWAGFYKGMDGLQLMNDEIRKNEERAKCKLLMEENKLLCLNMKSQKFQRMKDESSNFSTPEFQNQFNKSSR